MLRFAQCHHRKFQASFTMAFLMLFSLPAWPDSDAAARMAKLPFIVRKGDSSVIVFRTIDQKKGQEEIFEVRMQLNVAGELRPTNWGETGRGYIAEYALVDAHMVGKQARAGTTEWLRKVMPPIRLKTDQDFMPVEVMNWEQVVKESSAALRKLKPADPGEMAAMAAILSNKDFMLNMYQQMSELQRPRWTLKNGVYAVGVRKANGATQLSGVSNFIPKKVTGDTLHVAIATKFDTVEHNKKMNQTPIGKLVNAERVKKGEPENLMDITMSSVGEARYDLKTGWLLDAREVLTATTDNIPLKAGEKPRTVTIEVKQTRSGNGP